VIQKLIQLKNDNRNLTLQVSLNEIKLMTGNAPMKHSLHEKKAASVLLSCSSVVLNDATPLTPLAHERNSFSKCKHYTIHDPRGPEEYNYTMMECVATFYSRHTGTTHQLLLVKLN